jgi:hypothetical protein
VFITNRFKVIIYLGTFVLVFIGLVGCNSSPTTVPTETPVPTTNPVGIPTATQTLTPTATSEPSLVILLAPPGSDLSQLEELQPVLDKLASESGMRLETRKEIVEGGINLSVKLVVVLPPYQGLSDLALRFPETNFLAVGFPDLEPTQNLIVMGSSGGRPSQQGFLAGYISAVITPDWRVGVISPADSAAGEAASQGFVNGAVFFCGLCRPAYPPFNQYPMIVELPAGASQEQQIAAADSLISSAVETVYIVPGAGEGALIEYLADSGINLIGGALPTVETQHRWVVTIRTNLSDAIEQNWNELLQVSAGYSMESPLVLTDINESLFSPGRQKLVEKIMDDLLAGYIDPGATP